MPDHRPLFHPRPQSNWINDPNGPLYWRGNYHIFYQYNQRAPVMGIMDWGHATSPDLVHWSHMPAALTPSPGGPDKDGCCVERAADGHWVEKVCVATSEDEDLVHWRKDPASPVIASPPDGLDLSDFRDPCVWREADRWLCVIGGARRGRGGVALLYSSNDLRQWHYVGVLCSDLGGEAGRLGPDAKWECPQFFALGDRHVLLVGLCDSSGLLYTSCTVGQFDGAVFTPESTTRFDLGAESYAPSTMLDPRGRRLVWGWVREGRSADATRADGWAGALSLPRVVTVQSDGTLGIAPLPELAGLRQRKLLQHAHCTIVPGAPCALPELHGDTIEIELEVGCEAAACVSIQLRRSPDGAEYTELRYDAPTGRLEIDRTHASLAPENSQGQHGGELLLQPGELLSLHIFLDRSIIEVFANGRVSITERIYPSRDDSLETRIEARSGKVEIVNVQAWELG
jgi:beta-fructofuranosidase